VEQHGAAPVAKLATLRPLPPITSWNDPPRVASALTTRRRGLCRVPNGLPRAKYRVLGKEYGPEAYSNPTVHNRLSEYTSMVREIHGVECDPTTEDLDGEVVMRIGGGKKHGRYWIADGAIDSSSTPTLSQIRARSTSASPAIRTRLDTSQLHIETLQVISSLSAVH
jgi:hypothetical protein